jgi:hypothetical protein
VDQILASVSGLRIFLKCNIYTLIQTPEEKFATRVAVSSMDISRMQRRQRKHFLKMDG